VARILVAGAGGLGSLYGGFLRRAGHEVGLLGRAHHLEAIATHGLSIEGIFGSPVLIGATVPEPGRLRVTLYAKPVKIGPPWRAGSVEAAEHWAALIDRAGVPSEAVAELFPFLWEKMLYNAPLNALGAILGLEECRGHVYERLLPPTAGHRSSMLQDLEQGRRTEIDALNGYIARRGAELGAPAPVNATLTAIVRILEGRKRGAGPAPSARDP